MESLGKKTAVSAAVAAVLYLVLFFFVDQPVLIFVHRHWYGTWAWKLGTNISEMAGGAAVEIAIVFFLALILIADPKLKRHSTRFLLYVCVSLTVAIVVGTAFKFILGRYRPVMLFDHGLYGLHFFSTRWELTSTPSGHTLKAFAILTALSMRFRRLTAFFMALALLVGAGRVAVAAHYPSDVLFGAFIGIFSALWTFKYFRLQGGDPCISPPASTG